MGKKRERRERREAMDHAIWDALHYEKRMHLEYRQLAFDAIDALKRAWEALSGDVTLNDGEWALLIQDVGEISCRPEFIEGKDEADIPF